MSTYFVTRQAGELIPCLDVFYIILHKFTPEKVEKRDYMISSPSPTQQPPDPDVQPAERQGRSTSIKQRPGQTPAAKFVKAIFRPLFKGIYYLLRGIRTHKLVTLGIVVLLLISVFATSFVLTRQMPFGIGQDQFDFHVNGKNGGGDLVKNWLYAVRDGNVTQLALLQKNINQPPDPNQLVNQFSQAKAHLTWKAINVISAYSESDTTVDSFVEVDLSASGPGGNSSALVIFHFVTLNSQGEFLINADVVSFRPTLR